MIVRLLLLLLILSLALAVNLYFGSVALAPARIIAALGSSSQDSNVSAIIWQIRVPRMLCAMCVGAALGVSGYLLQTLSRNPLADPYLTGVSSGAALCFAVAILLEIPFAATPAVAAAGGLLASLLVAIMARTSSGLSATRLLLAGVAVSAVCSGIITMLLTGTANSARVQSLLYFLAGSVSGKGWSDLSGSVWYLCAAVAGALFLTKPLRILGLGELPAKSVGLDVARMQAAVLIVAVVLCSVSVTLGGIVGFVGLTAPFFARAWFGSNERVHITAAAILGAILVLVCDLIARIAGQGQELPLNTLLSLVGAPFFLWLIRRHNEAR